MKINEVAMLTGVPRSSIYWRASRGEFPKPLKIGERASAWRSDQIEAWIAGKVRAAELAEV